MSYQAKIKRYLQILQLIEKSKYPSAAEMLTRINDSGIKVADRQLKRDIESLRYEFGLDIQYSVIRNGYYIQNEDLTFPYFLKLLEFAQNIDLLTSYLRDGSTIADIIEFEEYSSFKGLQYIRDIACCIQNSTEIRLEYKRFDSEVTKSYRLQPYLLREYMNRWYVIGHLAETNEIRTFGLDRVIDLHDLGVKFKKGGINDVISLFQNVVGINACEGTIPEEIELVCNSYLGNLLQTLPLHESQKVIKETDNEITLSFRLIINLELKQRFLMMATQARVTKPLKLKAEMMAMIEEAHILYLK
jgi:predicted DNA-binding transcriptional regulator YafY